jgi:hypothetical protein
VPTAAGQLKVDAVWPAAGRDLIARSPAEVALAAALGAVVSASYDIPMRIGGTEVRSGAIVSPRSTKRIHLAHD